MIGRTIGHYEVVAPLGEGAMGEVYRARDLRLGREVAIKLLPAAVAADADRLRRLRREARALAAVSHPGIVTVHSVEEEDGVQFLTMELVAGHNLDELITRRGLELPRFLELAVPLAQAVAAAHACGVVHRDLKPANVMVSDEGQVKVLDFGLAALRGGDTAVVGSEESLETLTEPGSIVGTVPYMSPEQVEGRPADARSDVFSLGVILYELLAGHRPFSGESAAAVFSAILTGTPVPLTAARDDLPPRLDQIVRRCLAKRPGERYQSVCDLAHDLANLAGEPEAAAAERTLVEAPRRRWWLLAAAVVVVIVGAVGWRLFTQGATSPAAARAASIRSVAVLPFDNLMRDPAQDYFVDGMHEALITTLAKLGGLRVTSRTSAMHFKGTGATVPEIARELGVDAVIEGSVLRSGSRVRITAQLISGATDEHLWADSYDRDVGDVFALLSEVASAIAGEIGAALTPDQQELFSGQRRPVSLQVQEAYLRGRQAVNEMTRDGRRRARAHFQEAVGLDPEFAPAWSGLAGVTLLDGLFGRAPLAATRAGVEETARKALALDPTLGRPWGVLGYTRLYLDWDWSAAQEYLSRAVELDPTDALVRHGYADLLLVQGKSEESLQQVLLGQKHDPFSWIANYVVVGHLLFAHRFEDVLAEADRVEAKFPGRRVAGFRASALWQLGHREEALDELRRSWAGRAPEVAAALDRGRATGGAPGAAEAVAEALERMADEGSNGALEAATYYALGGDPEGCARMLERALHARDPFLLHIKADSRYDAVRDDPGVRSIIRRIGFPG